MAAFVAASDYTSNCIFGFCAVPQMPIDRDECIGPSAPARRLRHIRSPLG